MQLAYDDECLYLGVMAYDREPEGIVARLVRRDQWTEADHVQVMIDAHHDHQTAYWFRVNAAGSLNDGHISNDGDGWDAWDETWNGVWDARVSRCDQGWSVEFRIPYRVLRFSPREADTWGINVDRHISRKKERLCWVMVPRKENGCVSRFAHLDGIEGIAPRRALELLPYAVGRSTFAPVGDPDHRDLFGSLGADVRYGVTSGVSFNAALNPDFGQVETDPAELNLSVFETHQDERRPFFLEGSQMFETPIQLFYSRRIGRQPGYRSVPDGYETAEQADFTTILAAAKMTGKTARQTTFAVMEALTASEDARIESTFTDLISGEERTQERGILVEPRANFLVGRVKQDLFAGNSHIGLLATALNRHRAADAYSGGVDWNVKWRDNAFSFSGQLAGSRAGPAEDRTQGLGNQMAVRKNSGWYRGELWWEAYSRGFEVNDLGFLWRTDYYLPWLWAQVRKDEPWACFRRNSFNVNRWGMWNFDGVALGDGVNIETWNQLANFWWVGMEFTHEFRTRDDLDTRGGPPIVRPASTEYELFVESDSRRAISGWGWFEWGSNEAGSTWRALGPTVTFRATPNIEFRFRPRYRWGSHDAQWI